MVTAPCWIRVLFARQERVRHNIAMISIWRTRLETGAAKFDWARGWLGLPSAVGTQQQWCQS